MRKIYLKLIAVILTLALSVTVVVMSSYAWFVLSESPMVTGIQVAIGGGNTILIAPDIREIVGGVVYHYPGYFSDTMNIHQQPGYAYLSKVAGLTPVSTADGVHWFLPAYYDGTDKEVREGTVLSGQLKDISQFYMDTEMAHANLPKEQTKLIEEGSYLYMDFWVVSPSADFTLRVSTGEDTAGSFVVDLPNVVTTEDTIGYDMVESQVKGSSALRVGFLANDVGLTDDTMLHYQNSAYFREEYKILRGLYQEPKTGTPELEANRFTIYEPNCNLTYEGQAVGYRITNPLGLVDGVVQEVSVADRLTAQTYSTWLPASTGIGTEVAQRFRAAVVTMDTQNQNLTQLQSGFFNDYLQCQVSPYVTNGTFFKRTGDLYTFNGSITPEQLAQLDSQGATEDVYIIQLEKGVPQRIRMFIWLEGQDADCVNEVAASSVLLNLELAGSSEE
jgi:hypothetical protein